MGIVLSSKPIFQNHFKKEYIVFQMKRDSGWPWKSFFPYVFEQENIYNWHISLKNLAMLS